MQKNRKKLFFCNQVLILIDLSITPNRPDCLGVRGIARDLSAAGFGKLKTRLKIQKIKSNKKLRQLKVKITKEKNQGCFLLEVA